MMRICGVSIMIEPHEMTVTTIMTQSKYGTRPRSFLQKNKITFQHSLQTNKSSTEDNSLDLAVLRVDFFSGGERVARSVFVACMHDTTAQSAEASVATDGEERRVEERVVLAQVLLLLRPAHKIETKTL